MYIYINGVNVTKKMKNFANVHDVAYQTNILSPKTNKQTNKQTNKCNR